MFNIFNRSDRTELYYKKQRYKKGFANCDCWGLSYWLTTTFPQMILTLRDMKNGAPELSFEEYDTLPEYWKNVELQKLKKLEEQQGYTYNPNSIFTKWYILLTRMAYCLKEANEDKEMYNPYKQEYNEQLKKEFNSITPKEYEYKYKYKYKFKHKHINKELEQKYWDKEYENESYKNKMKDEALDLIKKYFYNLWD